VTTSDAPAAEQRACLSKCLKPRWVWAIALGSAVGWGAFILPTDWLATAGPLGAVVGFGIGAALMLVIAVSYGFLVKSFPVSGGEFAYAYAGFGRRHAFLCGWFLTLGYMCIVALNASALALLGRRVLPQLVEQGRLYEIAGWDVFLGEVVVATAAIVAFAWMNIRGASVSGRLQFVFCLIMLGAVCLILAGVVLHPDTPWTNMTPAFPSGVPPWTAILAIVAIAPWAFVGFDNVPQAAEEFDFPASRAFGLICMAIFVAALLYAAMVVATAWATPWTALVEGKPIWGTADAMAGLFGGVGVLVLALAVAMGVSTGLNGFYVAASRLLFAMGRARFIPEAFGRLHHKHGTPHVGIAFTASLCLVAPWFGREVLLWIVDMSAIGVTIAYIYTCLVAFRMFRGGAGALRVPDGDGGGNRAPLYKQGLSLAGAVIGAIFLLLLVVPASPASLAAPSAIALMVWCLLGAAFYATRMRHNRAIPDDEMGYLIFGGERPVPGPTAARVEAAADPATVAP
jgi:amino acid transporter